MVLSLYVQRTFLSCCSYYAKGDPPSSVTAAYLHRGVRRDAFCQSRSAASRPHLSPTSTLESVSDLPEAWIKRHDPTPLIALRRFQPLTDVAGGVSGSSAYGQWEAHHPRYATLRSDTPAPPNRECPHRALGDCDIPAQQVFCRPNWPTRGDRLSRGPPTRHEGPPGNAPQGCPGGPTARL
jgi:hypothetical protein